MSWRRRLRPRRASSSLSQNRIGLPSRSGEPVDKPVYRQCRSPRCHRLNPSPQAVRDRRSFHQRRCKEFINPWPWGSLCVRVADPWRHIGHESRRSRRGMRDIARSHSSCHHDLTRHAGNAGPQAAARNFIGQRVLHRGRPDPDRGNSSRCRDLRVNACDLRSCRLVAPPRRGERARRTSGSYCTAREVTGRHR